MSCEPHRECGSRKAGESGLCKTELRTFRWVFQI